MLLRPASGGIRPLTLFLISLLAASGICASQALASEHGQKLDDFEVLEGWTALSSDGARVEIAQDAGRNGMAMRVDYEFAAGAGHILVKKNFPIAIPENYVFSFDLRGEGPSNDFEFKLLDATSTNVWWRRQPRFDFPEEWQDVKMRKSRIQFAWGPRHEAQLAEVGAIEFGISATAPGKGSIWIDDLRFEPRPPTAGVAGVSQVRASTAAPEHAPELVLDTDPATVWQSGAVTDDQWLQLDFGKTREFGGLVIDWAPEDFATAYRVEVSDDETEWSTAYESKAGNGARDYIYLPDAESRFVRLKLEKSSRGQGYAIAALTVKPFAFSASPTGFFQEIAKDSPQGAFPKYIYGKQTYWTVVGVRQDNEEGLLNEEGMLEVEKGGFSIEPFLHAGGSLFAWNTPTITRSLDRGYLPIPSVRWDAEEQGLALTVTAFAGGEAGKSRLYARYRVENKRSEFQHATLFLAMRPFQVVPPWQSLNMEGGASPIHHIRFDGDRALVNGKKSVVSLAKPDRVGATALEGGMVVEFLQQDTVPPATEVTDSLGFASGAFAYGLDLQPGASAEIDLVIPFHEQTIAESGAGEAKIDAGAELEKVRDDWDRTLHHVRFDLPPQADRIANSLLSTLAYILINQDGPSIQPGSRSYARSWIRDGAITSTALLQSGFPQEVHDFLKWFARYQFDDGKVPCCIDHRGPDPIPENDSNGQFIYAVMEYYRHTRDIGFLSEMWPSVIRAVDYLSSLRRQRMTEAFRAPENRAYFGILPESISHEGYASRPVHSYWDNLFALRGLKDAASMALVMGDEERAASYADLREAFRGDLYASMFNTMAQHKIDYLPASVELGDFDPNSTAIGVAPVGEQDDLPEPALTRTFDRYYEVFRERQDGVKGWDAYTPYEVRNVETFVRLGQRERALDVLNSLVADQRPAAWNQWTEIVWRDPTAPRFIGDMPHTWVGSDFMHAVRSLFAFEREADAALVLAGGIPREWLESGSEMGVTRLPTEYGTLTYRMQETGPGRISFRLLGDLTVPPGGIVLEPPTPRPIKGARVNGREVSGFSAGHGFVIEEFPAEVELRY